MSGKKQVKQYYQSGAVRDCIVEEMPKDGKKPSHLTELATEDPCPVCDAEYLSHILTCSDCGEELVKFSYEK